MAAILVDPELLGGLGEQDNFLAHGKSLNGFIVGNGSVTILIQYL